MNGAESLVRTLVGGGVNVCFSNPGTSEMHFVAALDRVDGMRCVLALFEGVATGAADGYARMAEKPAATLLHLGPGLANGLANIHNAMKASTPLVNIVGDHATYHRGYNSPLTSDIETAAKPFSGWVKTSPTAKTVAADGAAAIAAAMTPPGQVATLILPGDTAWDEGSGPAPVPAAPVTTPSNSPRTQRMPSTRSSAATKCISEVPGLAKQTSTPPATNVRTRLSAPFMLSLSFTIILQAADDQPFFVPFVKGLPAQCSHRLGHVAFLNRGVRKCRGHGLVACETAAIVACLVAYCGFSRGRK